MEQHAQLYLQGPLPKRGLKTLAKVQIRLKCAEVGFRFFVIVGSQKLVF